MMDQHDSLLASYNSMYHIKAYEEKLLKDIATGRDAAERKRKQEQDAYELKLKEQEDGRYDALVEVLRYIERLLARLTVIANPTLVS